MAYAFVNSIAFGPGQTGGTSSAVNMSGADLFVAIVGSANLSTLTWSDSQSNTHWTNLTVNSATSVISYCWGATGGSTMTFTISAAASTYPGCVVFGFSGSQTSSDPLDSETHGDHIVGTPSAQFTTAITPGAANELFVWGFGNNTSTDTFTCTGYTVTTEPFTGGTNYEGVGGYKIKTDAVAEQPTVVDVQSGAINTFPSFACFKVGAGGGVTDAQEWLMGTSPRRFGYDAKVGY